MQRLVLYLSMGQIEFTLNYVHTTSLHLDPPGPHGALYFGLNATVRPFTGLYCHFATACKSMSQVQVILASLYLYPGKKILQYLLW